MVDQHLIQIIFPKSAKPPVLRHKRRVIGVGNPDLRVIDDDPGAVATY
jgi:hypothetical protein